MIDTIPISAPGAAGIAAIRAQLAGRPRDETLSLPERRDAIERFTAPSSAAVAVQVDSYAGVRIERHEPAGAPADRVILYAHGGAYVLGSATTHRALAAAVAEAAGLRLWAVDYRLAPEHPFPAARDDIAAVARAVAETGTRFAMFGDSAGGGVALQAALALSARPAAIAVTSPWLDFTLSGQSYRNKASSEAMLTPEGLTLDAARYLNGRDPWDPAVSVLHAELAGLPPLLVQVGEDELLLDDARALAARARGAGVHVEFEVWAGMIHSWHAFRNMVPEADQAIQRIGRFLRNALGNTGN